jgi:hypothetical protein
MHQRALEVVQEMRGAPPPTGPGTEALTWGRCITRHLVSRADGPGTPEEIIEASARDCTAEEANTRAVAVRELGTAGADRQMAQIQAGTREFELQLVTQIRASHDANAPARPDPR